MENKKSECGCGNLPVNSSTQCNMSHVVNPKYIFKNGKCYKDDIYFGKIIKELVTKKGTEIHVEIDNGNMYMKGQIEIFHFHL